MEVSKISKKGGVSEILARKGVIERKGGFGFKRGGLKEFVDKKFDLDVHLKVFNLRAKIDQL